MNAVNMKNYKLINNDNTEFSLYDFQANNYLLLLFFRGAWCNHCKRQLQELQKNIHELEKNKIKLIALSSDSKFNSSLLKTFLHLDFPIISDAAFKLIDDYNLRVTYKEKEVSKPAVFLYNPNHEEVFRFIGETYDDRISAKELLPQFKKIINQ